jgi:hypothetical protein
MAALFRTVLVLVAAMVRCRLLSAHARPPLPKFAWPDVPAVAVRPASVSDGQ